MESVRVLTAVALHVGHELISALTCWPMDGEPEAFVVLPPDLNASSRHVDEEVTPRTHCEMVEFPGIASEMEAWHPGDLALGGAPLNQQLAPRTHTVYRAQRQVRPTTLYLDQFGALSNPWMVCAPVWRSGQSLRIQAHWANVGVDMLTQATHYHRSRQPVSSHEIERSWWQRHYIRMKRYRQTVNSLCGSFVRSPSATCTSK